jgi:hypothetical protein
MLSRVVSSIIADTIPNVNYSIGQHLAKGQIMAYVLWQSFYSCYSLTQAMTDSSNRSLMHVKSMPHVVHQVIFSLLIYHMGRDNS